MSHFAMDRWVQSARAFFADGRASTLLLVLAFCCFAWVVWATPPPNSDAQGDSHGRKQPPGSDKSVGSDQGPRLFTRADGSWDLLAGSGMVESMTTEDLLGLGRRYLGQGRHDDARGATLAALSRDPGFAQAWVLLGEIHSRSGNHAEAVSSFDRALTLGGADNLARMGIVLNMVTSGKPVEAEKLCREYIARSGSTPELLLALGEALEDQGKFEDAFVAYGRALEADPNFAPAHSRRGRLFSRHGQYEAAVFECRVALALDPDDNIAHTYLTFALTHLKEKDIAKERRAKAKAAGQGVSVVETSGGE